MKTRGLLRVLPLLFVVFKDKLQDAFRYESKQARIRVMNGRYTFGGFRARNLGAIYIQRPNRKFKGYMRENRKCTFNKNK